MASSVVLTAVLASTLAVLVAANLLNNRYARSAYLVTSPVAAAVLLALYALSGHPWVDAGLGAGTLGRGVRWGPVLVALVALGCLAGALLPVTRAVFLDRRVADDGPGAVAYQVLVRIPLGTVLLEEVAFRGVLYGLLRTPSGAGWATAVSAWLFGLWHVLPSLDLPRLNPAAARVRPALVAPGAVALTALVGVALCELQRRSRSLVAPATLHWALNAFGYLTAYLTTHAVYRRAHTS